MRRVERTIKVQWRVLVGNEGCVQRRLRILTSLSIMLIYVLVMFVCVRSTSMIFSSVLFVDVFSLGMPVLECKVVLSSHVVIYLFFVLA